MGETICVLRSVAIIPNFLAIVLDIPVIAKNIARESKSVARDVKLL